MIVHLLGLLLLAQLGTAQPTPTVALATPTVAAAVSPTPAPTVAPTATPAPVTPSCGFLEWPVPSPLGGTLTCVNIFDITGSLLHGLSVFSAQLVAFVIPPVVALTTVTINFAGGGIFQPLDDLYWLIFQASLILFGVVSLIRTAWVVGTVALRNPYRAFGEIAGPLTRSFVLLCLANWAIWGSFLVVASLVGVIGPVSSADLSKALVSAITAQQGDNAPAQAILAVLDIAFAVVFIVVAFCVAREYIIALFMLAFLFVIAPLCIIALALPPPASHAGTWWLQHFVAYILYPVAIAIGMKLDLMLLFDLQANSDFSSIAAERLLGLVGLVVLLRCLRMLHGIIGGTHPGQMGLPDVQGAVVGWARGMLS